MPDTIVESNPQKAGTPELQSFFDAPSKSADKKTDSTSASGGSSSSSEKKEEKKAESVKETEKKVEAKSDAVKDEIKEEPKSSDAKKDEVKTTPSVNWDTDDNPYKKRYQDTQQWGNNLNQQYLELKKNTEMINKKLDGTWNPEEEAKANQPDPKQLMTHAEILGKVKASSKIAAEKYGMDKVQSMIFSDTAPFRKFDNDPHIQARVLSSDAPVLEAFAILEEMEFRSKWGNDAKTIEENIRHKHEEEMTKTITENVTKQIMERLSLKEKQVTTVGDARSSESGQKTGETGHPSLRSIFDGR